MKFGGNTTCLQIEIPDSDELLILDCGTGFRNLGNFLDGKEYPHQGRVFITHPHWDHLQGFPFFKPFYNGDNWFRVYIPPQGKMGCKEILQGHMSSTFFPVSIDMLEADMDCETFYQERINFEHYSVDYMWANHTVDTAIFKFYIGEKVIVFAPDNEIPTNNTKEVKEFLSEFRTFIRGADVLIHDGQFNADQYKSRKGWGHSAWEEVIPIAKEEGVKRLYLTHHDPDSTDDYLEEMDARIRKEYESDFEFICFAKEGLSIKLPFEEVDKKLASGI